VAWDKVSQDTKFEHFAVTYGDGLASVSLKEEFDFHMKQKKIGTVLGVRPDARWGELDIESENKVSGFLEKPENRSGFINGGFFFFNSEFRNYLSVDKNCILEREPLKKLAEDSQLVVYKHDGFWQAMDTLRDKMALQALWEKGSAPWVI
jgi:glucose-1-phosphate cytidylyltransferase